MSEVILVDTSDQVLGTADKLLVHTGSGQLHRAFSVFVFNAQGEMLIQRRAIEKYHFGGLWSNTVCSHPAPGEELGAAAQGRLAYEMGLTLPLRQEFSFQYRAEDSKTNLVEPMRRRNRMLRRWMPGAGSALKILPGSWNICRRRSPPGFR